jgi:hypothetical protein
MNELNELNEINELKTLWAKLLGEIPSDQQWEFWGLMHTTAVIRQGILKTAQKNLSTGGTMTSDHMIRFASKVMLTGSARNADHAANQARLAARMEQIAVEPTREELKTVSRHCGASLDSGVIEGKSTAEVA